MKTEIYQKIVESIRSGSSVEFEYYVDIIIGRKRDGSDIINRVFVCRPIKLGTDDCFVDSETGNQILLKEIINVYIDGRKVK